MRKIFVLMLMGLAVLACSDPDKVTGATADGGGAGNSEKADTKAQQVEADSVGYIVKLCRKEMPFIEKDIWLKHKDNPKFVLVGIDRDEPVETVVAFGKQTGVTYPLALDPGADIFAKYALRDAGITRNVLIDEEGRIVMMTRLYKEEEFASLVAKIDQMLQ